MSGIDQIPILKKAQGHAKEQNPNFVAQDATTLDSRLPIRRSVESVVDLDLLREPSPFRKIAVSASGGNREDSGEELKNGLALISAVYRESGKPENGADCSNVSLAVEQHVKLDPAKVLEIVETEVSANPTCACEIVKAAIKASDADVESVVSIVKVTITAVPEAMRIAAQCAIATVPESIAGVQALLAELDPNGGETGSSSKSAKDSKDSKFSNTSPETAVAALGSPLDFPGTGPVGPGFGNPGGQPLIPNAPPVIITPPVTDVNP